MVLNQVSGRLNGAEKWLRTDGSEKDEYPTNTCADIDEANTIMCRIKWLFKGEILSK
jgi:hypothetical protein